MHRAAFAIVVLLVVLTASFACAARCANFACEPQTAKMPPCHQQKSSNCQAPQLVAMVKAEAPLIHLEADAPLHVLAASPLREIRVPVIERAVAQLDPPVAPPTILRI